MSRHSVGSRLYTPPRFNGVVKAVENKNKGRDYTKIGNLDIIQEQQRQGNYKDIMDIMDIATEVDRIQLQENGAQLNGNCFNYI